MRLAPPTLATLEDLERTPALDEVNRSTSLPVPPIDPELIHLDDGGMALVLPGDPLHSRPLDPAPHRTRFVLETDGRFASRVVR
jgi:hypothetical protein